MPNMENLKSSCFQGTLPKRHKVYVYFLRELLLTSFSWIEKTADLKDNYYRKLRKHVTPKLQLMKILSSKLLPSNKNVLTNN